MRKLFPITILLLSTFAAIFIVQLSTVPVHGQSAAGILPSNRVTDWTQAGLAPVGGIPSGSWTQCGATIAAYIGTADTINNAIAACGTNQFVFLGPGNFSLSTPIIIKGRSRLVLRGSGANSTFLLFTGSTALCEGGLTHCLIDVESNDGTYPGSPGTVVDWTAGFAKGSTSITLSSGSNIVAGVTSIFLDQCDDGFTGTPCAGTSVDNGGFFNCATQYNSTTFVGCGNNGPSNVARTQRNQWEIVEAVSCSPACGSAGVTTITITPPIINPNWRSGQVPKAWFIQPSQYVGIENMSVDAGTLTPGATISVGSMSYSWVTGVRLLNGWQAGLLGWLSNHIEFSNNYIYDTGRAEAFNDPYAIRFNGESYLIQNNISQKTRDFVNAEGPAPGSVISYNYAVNMYHATDFMFGGYEPHSDGNNYLLFEGNVGISMINETIHGTQKVNTAYRNFFTGWESCGAYAGICGPASPTFGGTYPAGTYGFKDASLFPMLYDNGGRYPNIIANVLGTPGVHTAYQGSTGYPWIYKMGGSITPIDPLVASTSMRWGNYDVLTAAVRFCGNSSSTGWVANCASTSEIPTGIATFPVSIPTVGDVAAGQSAFPGSFYLSSAPSFFTGPGITWPGIGPDVTNGTIGICSGARNLAGQLGSLPATTNAQCVGTSRTTPAWGGHANANPAQHCFLEIMGGSPNGANGPLAFNPINCYQAPVATVLLTPTSLAFSYVVQATASSPQTITLTNTGGSSLTITSFAASSDYSVSTSPSCNTGCTVVASGTVVATVTFTPTVLGADNGTLTIIDSATGSPRTAALTGTGIVNPTGTGAPQGSLIGMTWTNDKYAFYRCLSCGPDCYSCPLPFGVKPPKITFN